jgi:hypothetical protein
MKNEGLYIPSKGVQMRSTDEADRKVGLRINGEMKVLRMVTLLPRIAPGRQQNLCRSVLVVSVMKLSFIVHTYSLSCRSCALLFS